MSDGKMDGLDYLYEHQHDHEWAKIVLSKYNEIIEDYDEEDRPEVCSVLAATLGNWAASFKSKKDSRKVDEISLKIGRIGLNLFNLIKPKASDEYLLVSIKIVADLFRVVGLSLESTGRYIACQRYLDEA